jgi:exopolysaccharide biosynthesis protein
MKKLKIIEVLTKLTLSVFAIVAVTYPIAVYSSNPFIKKWRNLYIETAMTTFHHQWLATSFIPKEVIDDVMNTYNQERDMLQNITAVWENTAYAKEEEEDYEIVEEEVISKEDEFYSKFWELDTEEFRSFLTENPEFLENDYDNIFIDNSKYKYDIKTTLDERVYVLDSKNNLLIVEVKGSSYVGKLAIVKDGNQVRLVKSKTLGSYGTLLREFYTENDALLTVNCSGFADQDFKGNGGTVQGSFVLDGEDLGKPKSKYLLFGIKQDDRFYVEKVDECDVTEYKWAAQFRPALIINGEKVVNGTFGYGIQPRTAIGQTLTGEMLLLIIDGRQIGYSLGATVSDLADIMLNHKAYQAVNADGGSSSLMWYEGKNITKPSSTNYLGRYLPNAIIVDYAEE